MRITRQSNHRSTLENIANYVANTWVIEKRGPSVEEINRLVADYETNEKRAQILTDYASKVSDVYESIKEKAIEIARGTYTRAVDLNMFLSALLFGIGGAGVGYLAENTGKGALIGAGIGVLLRLNGARMGRNKRINALADEAGRSVEALADNYSSELASKI